MQTFSLYRGQSRTGIGEGPGNPPVPHGEQYLAADGPLAADGGLLSACRSWMTRDWRVTDEQELGERIEAWSYFRHGPLRLVVRLVAAGVYDRRNAYFAHGRAFRDAEIAGECDPGAYLGRSQAFDEPWRDGQRPAPKGLPPLDVVRPEQIQQEPEVAAALLAHLYQGLISGYPVVMAVPVSEFVAGSALHALVSFARAALPRELKVDCQLRVFTRLPELFLRHLQANLIVIPEKEAADALVARRDATLLDRRGRSREGRGLSREAAGYAEAVLRRFLAFKGAGLLAFSGAIGTYLPTDRLPSEQEIVRVPALYNFLIARADPARLGEWLRCSLLKKVEDHPTGLPWDRLIRSEDWHALSFDDLTEIVLTEVTGEEARKLVERAEVEARRSERQEQIPEERLLNRLRDLPDERRPALLVRLLGTAEGQRPLVAIDVAARRSAELSLPELLTASTAAPLLAAELATGLLDQRARDVTGLARAAAREPKVAGVLTRATGEGVLSPDWAQDLLKDADEAAVIGAAAEILPVAIASLPCRPILKSLFHRLLVLPSPPASLQAPLAAALRRADAADPASGPDDWLILIELLERSRAQEAGAAVEEAWRTAERLSDPGDRRDFIRRVADPAWRSLQPARLVSAEGRFSPDWAKDFADLLLQSEEVRDGLSTPTLLALAGRRPELGVWVDPRMQREPAETTDLLVAAGTWSLWRRRSGLAAALLHQAALAWLTAAIWKRRPAPDARLEDWKQVMSDLRELDAEGLRSLFGGRPPRPLWPRIIPFQDEQLRDLCRAARSDLGVLAELAESLDPERDLQYSIDAPLFEHVLALAEPANEVALPPNALAYLAESDKAPKVPLSPRQSAFLYRTTSHRRERAAAAVHQSVKAHIASESLAALQAADLLPTWDRDLQSTISHWHKTRGPGKAPPAIGEILQRRLSPGHVSPSAVSTQEVRALLERDATASCWKRLAQEIWSYVRKGNSQAPHPLSRVVAGLTEASSSAASRPRAIPDLSPWKTFVAVAKDQPLVLRQPLLKGTALPALEVAVLLLPHLGPGCAALRLLFLAGDYQHLNQADWWDSLLAGVAGQCRTRGLGDREEVAITLIQQAIPDLFPTPNSAQPALVALDDWMQRFYLRQGIPLPPDFEHRRPAGAAT